MSFESISDDQCSSFKSALTSGRYTLLLGSGISADSSNLKGRLLTADQLRLALCELKSVPESAPLQQVFSLLTADEIREHVTGRFINCNHGPSLRKFPTFIWKRAFTFNIDDAFQSAYSDPSSLQSVTTYHFDDPYESNGIISTLPLVHLHGYVQQEKRGYIFSRNQYIQQMNRHNPWMMILAQIISSDPIIIIGSSLDEVDLDYYLSFRTKTSSRDDEGPSIFVSPNADALTKHHCEKYGMLHFVGTCKDFLNYCDSKVSTRPTPIEMISAASRSLLPPDTLERDVLSFWSDFELVPGIVGESAELSRFPYGHPPNWNDLVDRLDVARPVSAQIIETVERKLHNPNDPKRLLVLFDIAGGGKTTILHRCAYEFATRGITTLRCTSLSRLEPSSTAKMLDTIPEPLVIIVDNFADQVTSFQAILNTIRKRGVLVLAGERSYRTRYITQALSGMEFHSFTGSELRQSEVSQLLQNYITLGIVGDERAISHPREFIVKVTKDPIAVACCRLLNDFRPLERIIASALDEGTDVEIRRYLIAALARYCYSGGVRYSIVSSNYETGGLNAQFRRDHPLPLTFISRDRGGGFVVPQNATLADNLLNMIKRDRKDELLEVFVDLGNAIAPRVNRKSIMQRAPEARLAGRLFDFDDVVEPFLGEQARLFYNRTQDEWQWNSRYWEQVAQLHLAKHHSAPNTSEGQDALARAIQHARHAVSIERHPFPLTTLAQTLIAQMTARCAIDAAAYEEALEKLLLAIKLERSRARRAVHPFVTLFRGSRIFLERGGQLSVVNAEELRSRIREARTQFPMDGEVKELGDALWSCLE